MTDILYDTYVPLPKDLQREIGGDTDYNTLDEVVSAFKNPNSGADASFVFKYNARVIVVLGDRVLIYRERGT